MSDRGGVLALAQLGVVGICAGGSVPSGRDGPRVARPAENGISGSGASSDCLRRRRRTSATLTARAMMARIAPPAARISVLYSSTVGPFFWEREACLVDVAEHGCIYFKTHTCGPLNGPHSGEGKLPNVKARPASSPRQVACYGALEAEPRRRFPSGTVHRGNRLPGSGMVPVRRSAKPCRVGMTSGGKSSRRPTRAVGGRPPVNGASRERRA